MTATSISTPTVSRATDRAARRGLDRVGIPGWLQAMPFGLVFAVLLHHPAHPRRHRQLLGLQRLCDAAGLHDAQLHRDLRRLPHSAAGSLHDPQDLCVDGEILLHRLAHDADHRLHDRLFPRLPHPLDDDADGAVPHLHHSVLDLERHPHDLVDPAARAQRARQRRAHARPCRRQAGRMAALFALLGVARVHPSLHLLHGRADLQFDDAHRQAPDRGGLRFRRLRLADAVEPDRARYRSRASSSARSSS